MMAPTREPVRITEGSAELYRMSSGDDGVRLDAFHLDSDYTHGKSIPIPEWARRVWTVAELGGFVMSSKIMPRKVLWFARHGPPKNHIAIRHYTDDAGAPEIIIPLENLYDDPENPD